MEETKKKVEIMIRRSAQPCEEMKRKKLKRRRETEESQNNDNEETEDGKVRERQKKNRQYKSEAEREREETKKGKARKFVRERMAAKVRMRGSKKRWITMEESCKDGSVNTMAGKGGGRGKGRREYIGGHRDRVGSYTSRCGSRIAKRTDGELNGKEEMGGETPCTRELHADAKLRERSVSRGSNERGHE